MVLSNSQWLANPGVTYEIEQSIRFNSTDSAFLSRTPSSGSAATQYAISVWCKRGLLDEQYIFMQGSDVNNLDILQFQSNSTLRFYQYPGSSTSDFITTQVFRDTGAWYHIVVIVDTTQGTAGDRVKIYVNGSRVTDFSTQTNPGSNATSMIGGTSQMTIGRKTPGTTHYHDGYMAEFNMVFGTPSIADFGETNSDTGQWVPVKYTGSYGTNGFYLKGEDSSDLGNDSSGNNNDFTSSGLTAADQVPDTPTPNADAAIGNRATLMSIQDGSPTMSEGNTRFSNSGSTRIQRTTNQPLVGKTYWEVLVNNNNQNTAGVSSDQISKFTNDTFYNQTTLVAGFDNANFYYNGSYTTYSQPSNSQRWMFAYDADTGKLWSGVNGTFHNSGDPAAGSGQVATLSTSYKWFPFIGGKSNADQQIIWGASNMSHTVPTGFTADLSTYRQPDPTIADPTAHFQTTLYTGNASTQEVNQSGNSTFEPGFVWIKTRSNTASHALFDQVRGVNKQLRSESTGTEYTSYSDLLTAFDADGFTLGADATVNNVNVNTYTYAAWQWKADGTSGSSNEDGSITSTVSADTTSGFSIATYTGTGSAATIGHGLGVAPAMVIVKKRDSGTDDAWIIWHQELPGANYYLNFDTGAQDTSVNYWNNTLPTSSVFSVGASNGTNQSSKTFVSYCFAEVEGFSKFGSFEGNGSSDGPFIYTGFRPAFFMMKRYDSTGAWLMFDDKRDGYNVDNDNLRADQTVGEQTDDFIDIVSSGVKIRSSATTWLNTSGGDYLYMAFAESPFKTANAR